MRNLGGASILLGLLLATVWGSGLALAADPQPEGITVVGNPQQPAIAFNDRQSTYLLVWGEDRGRDTGLDLFALRLNGNGRPLGRAFPVVIAAGDQVSPTLTFDSRDNEYLLVWAEMAFGDEYDIFGQRLSGGGRPISRFFPLVLEPGDQRAPDVAYDRRDDEFYLVWEDDRNRESTGVDVWGQRFSSSRTPIRRVPPFAVVEEPGDQTAPDVAYNRDSGEFVLVWEDNRNTAVGGLDIFAKRLNGNGWPYPWDFAVSSAPGDRTSPALAYAVGQGGFVAVWSQEEADVSELSLFGRRLNTVGRPLVPGFPVDTAPGNKTSSDLGFNTTNGDFLLVWSDDRRGGESLDIRARELNSNGRALAPDFVLVMGGR